MVTLSAWRSAQRASGHRRGAAALVASLSIVLGLSGCGGDSDSVDLASVSPAPAAYATPANAAPDERDAAAATVQSADRAVLSAGATLAPSAHLDQVGGYQLLMQPDGDLVLRWAGASLWSSGTSGHPGASATLAPDGNFVVADAVGPLWSTQTSGSGATTLILDPVGNLVLGGGAATVWTSGSDGARGRITSIASPNGANVLHVQEDGNVVIYAAGAPGWSTGTAGRAGASLELQGDGNLVLSDGTGVIWASGTAGTGATEAAIGDDGALRLVTPSGAPARQAGPPPRPAIPVPVAGAPAGGPPPAGAPTAGAPAAPMPETPTQRGPAVPAPQEQPAAAEAPQGPTLPDSDYGLASALLGEINAYRQANGLNPLQQSGTLAGYARSCAANMAATDAPLAHCRSGEIIQYNTMSSPHAWLIAYQNSPSHNAIMLIPDLVYFGAGVSVSPGGRYYNVVNVGY